MRILASALIPLGVLASIAWGTLLTYGLVSLVFLD
jgi:hypothetical protein